MYHFSQCCLRVLLSRVFFSKMWKYLPGVLKRYRSKGCKKEKVGEMEGGGGIFWASEI